MILIDLEPLYKQYLELEKQAKECQMDYFDHLKADSPNVIKWTAILTERTAYKYDLLDAPRVDAVPVVRCKDCKYWQDNNGEYPHEDCKWNHDETPNEDDYCSAGERKDETK